MLRVSIAMQRFLNFYFDVDVVVFGGPVVLDY